MLTEKESKYKDIELMSITEILTHINNEDQTIATAVKNAIPAIEKACQIIIEKMKEGGRLFYIGSGTSGRLGIMDAAECPPTFGIDSKHVTGLIAGGEDAVFEAIEHAEDKLDSGWEDLLMHNLSEKDFVIGISASGRTPYVLGALQKCSLYGIATAAITNNPDSLLAQEALVAIEIFTGPEFITGSTRMKAGTATKMVLNMISTTVMTKLGRIKDNKMVDMMLLNDKLIERGTKIIMDALHIKHDEAKALLIQKGSVRKVIEDIDSDE